MTQAETARDANARDSREKVEQPGYSTGGL